MSSRVDQIGEGRHTVLAEYLAVFLEFVAECGLDASSILASAGLAPEEVVQLPRFVGSKTYYRLIRSLLDQQPDPHHAYRFARRGSELRHGAAGMVAQNSQTLREGLDVGLRYARPQLGNSERLVVEVENREMVVLIRPPDPQIEIDESVDCFNSIVMLLGHELRGRRMAGMMSKSFSNELKVTHSAEGFSLARAGLPPGLKISFDAPQVELVLRSDYLDTPLLSPSTELRSIALRQLEGSDANANISDRVRAVFQSCEPEVPGVDQVCEALHMSRATLKRKLKADGATFQSLKDSFRLRRATFLLGDTEASVDEIADELGFSDTSGFTKAFRRWTGSAPRAWRLARQSDPGASSP
ncbi:MAG: helix-turn-helix domain-containing protein [Myxococcota bacterium]|nr:helix-turn-helix domain-containing protein [Myxococcota bacterium]